MVQQTGFWLKSRLKTTAGLVFITCLVFSPPNMRAVPGSDIIVSYGKGILSIQKTGLNADSTMTPKNFHFKGEDAFILETDTGIIDNSCFAGTFHYDFPA